MTYPGFSGMEVLTKEQVMMAGRKAVPGVCVLTGDGEGPFLDTGCVLNAKQLDTVDPYGLISVAKVRDMGRAIGMVPKEDVERLSEKLADYGEKVERLTKQVEALTAISELEKELVNG